MIHKTPWKLGFITRITGEKLESQQARRELGAPTPVLVMQTAAQMKPGCIYFRTTCKAHSLWIIWEVFLSFFMACVPNTHNIN